MLFRRRSPPPSHLLALDLETTGLDPRRDAILAVGMVVVAGGAILWGRRFDSLVADDRYARVGGAAALGTHQILPRETLEGCSLGEALERVRQMLPAGGALLGHGVEIEQRFLAAAARDLGAVPLRAPAVDTLRYLRALEGVRAHLSDRLPAHAAAHPIPTVLSEARRFFGLPEYPAHHALLDALASAELYLLLVARFPELHPPVRS
ncbi:MAG TPA: 3'-5' exonuclease [Thermoanaerobaculia bacterium]|nr:3'-5' exonuclease [Thermoanaerobaculia bacterium]